MSIDVDSTPSAFPFENGMSLKVSNSMIELVPVWSGSLNARPASELCRNTADDDELDAVAEEC